MELNIKKYCNREISCSCGHVHFCPIEDVIVEKGALEKLPVLLGGYTHIFLVADENTYATCGDKVCALLSDKLCGRLIYVREGLLVPDERAVAELEAAMPAQTELILGLGSGVINDTCKFVSFNKKLECAIIASAPSMDGYASSGAAMITDGMKVTYTTHPPKYIVADVDVVKNAPIDMIRAGYGDIVGKYSSLNDWQLSRLVNNEYFCQEIYDLVLDVTNNIRDSVKEIVARDDEAIAYLTKALVLIGVTLSLLGSTRPGSGSEHHLSHFFEIEGLIHDTPYFIHGTDVAYSTIVTAGMRERICKLSAPEFCEENKAVREAAWKRIYGPVAEEVMTLQKTAGSYERDRKGFYTEHWQEIIDILSVCPTEKQCAEMFAAAGFDLGAFEKMYGKAKIQDAMYYGKDLKDRYSVLWLYYALFAGKREA